MLLPVQITFRNADHSGALEEFIREKAAWLDSFYGRIIRCRVMVEVPHHRHRSGNPYHVRIELTVPGSELAISHDGSLHTGQKQKQMEQATKAAKVETAYKDPYLAIREAFDDARRQLQDYARRQRGQVKTHTVAGKTRRAL